MKVFNVTFTKEFDVFVRAKSIEEVRQAVLRDGGHILREGDEIDRDWNAGDWEFDIADLGSKRADMAVKDGELVNVLDTVVCNHEKPAPRAWCDACIKQAEEGRQEDG